MKINERFSEPSKNSQSLILIRFFLLFVLQQHMKIIPLSKSHKKKLQNFQQMKKKFMTITPFPSKSQIKSP